MILYGYIDNLSKKKWYRRSSNKTIWEFLWIDNRTVQRHLNKLKDKWYIEIKLSKNRHDRNVIPVWQNCRTCTTPVSYNIDNNNIDNNKLLSIYADYYWKDKWLDETVCNKLINTKLKQWITLDNIRIWMVLYNTECRIRQEWRYVKKFETWIKWFQPLTEEQIEETLTRLVREHKEKKKSDPKYTQWILAKTVRSDLCDTFWKDRVNGIFKRESSSETILNLT